MDKYNCAILNLLQSDSSITNAELAEKVALSVSQVSRRRNKLEEVGVIAAYRAELDVVRLGYELTAFITVTLTAHDAKTADEFSQFLIGLKAVKSAYALTGAADYLLHVRLKNLQELSDLVNTALLPHRNVDRVRSDISLQCIKENAPLQL